MRRRSLAMRSSIARAGTNYSVAASAIAALGGGFVLQATGNTTGTVSALSSGTVYLAGGNNITLSQNGQSVTISGAATVPTFSAGVSTGGNTSGTTGITGTNLVLAGGANVTLSQSNNTAGASVTISAGAGFSAGLSNLGNTSGATGVTGPQLVLAGGNGVTLSQSSNAAGATVTVSVQTQNVVDVSIGGNTSGTSTLVSSGTLVLAGGNNVTLSQNGQSITISAGTANPANLSVSAGSTSGTFGGITLSNSNGVSFGLNAGTITASVATQTVQTQNVVDVTLGGNTTGTLALISSGTLFLAGGNNVTLSQNGQSVTISANTVAAATLSVSAGASSGAFGGVTFSNSNNVSFGMNNGTITATASQSTQTQASGAIAGTGFTSTTTAGTAVVGTLNTSGLSLGVPVFLTNQTVQTQNLHDVSLSGNTVGALALISSGTMILAGGANVTLSQNGQSVTISANSAAAFSGGISNIGNTAGNTGITGTQLVFAGGNNITLSQVTGANGATVTVSAFTQTNQSLGIYASSQTYGQSSSSTIDARSLTVVGQGIMSVGLSGASLMLSANQTNQSIGLYASSQTTGQSSSSTIDARSLTIVGAGIISVGISQQSLIISGPGSTGISQSLYATGNTTQSSSGTVSIGSLLVQGAGNVSVGVSNGSLVISGAGGGGGGAGAAPGMSTFGNTAGTTGTFSSGTYVLVGTGPISLSQSTNASGATISINGPATSSLSGTGNASISVNASTIFIGANAAAISIGGNSTSAGAGYSNVSSGTLVLAGGSNVTLSQNGATVTISVGGGAATTANFYATGNTTQNSSSVLTLSSLLFNANGGATLGYSNGSIQVSVPATSSISATGWASLSINGSTIVVGAVAPQLSFFQPLGPVQSTTVTQNGAGSVQVYPAIAAFPFSASRVDMMASVSLSALALSTEAQSLSMYVGLYSLNGSTLSLASSGSQSYAWSNNSGGSSASLSGMRRFSAPINVNYTGGFDLFVGIMSNTTFANTNGISLSNVVVPLGPGPQLQGLIGQTQVNSMQFVPGQGIFSTSTAALPASIGLSQISGAGSGGNGVDYYVPVQFANVTA